LKVEGGQGGGKVGIELHRVLQFQASDRKLGYQAE